MSLVDIFGPWCAHLRTVASTIAIVKALYYGCPFFH